MQYHFESVPLEQIESRGIEADPPCKVPLVLVVDDEEVIADTLGEILRALGFAVVVCYDGDSAFLLANQMPPNVLLTDILMPGMNGIELAIRLTGMVADCRALLFSALPSDARLFRIMNFQRYNFKLLSKPLHPEELVRELAELGIRIPLPQA